VGEQEDPAKAPQASERRFKGRIAVFEATDSARSKTRDSASELGYRLSTGQSAAEIEKSALGEDPPEIVVVSLPEGRELVAALREVPRPPVILASLPGPHKNARERFEEFDADLYTLRPASTDSLGPVLHAATMLCHRNHRIQALRGAEDRMRERLQEAGHSGAVPGFQHFEFFRRVLVLEIKRAKRYGYGIAVCVVAPDPYAEPGPSQTLRDELSEKLAAAITASIRDIDMPVDYAEDRMLLFLPYTDATGAREVGERVAKSVRSSVHAHDGTDDIGRTVSVGIAALKQDKEDLSFARLMRDANAALRAAQLKGGDRVVCRE
jgi:diguanylate cyclase (GGDEF)-like protein